MLTWPIEVLNLAGDCDFTCMGAQVLICKVPLRASRGALGMLTWPIEVLNLAGDWDFTCMGAQVLICKVPPEGIQGCFGNAHLANWGP